jgi:pimeloyl-ACP methyl ester carboxylesterase
MNVNFSTDIMDYQALRSMAYTTFGGAEPGEVLVTAERIDSANADRWHEEWTRTADRVLETAESADESGHTRTARGAYFRAHNYYRTAEFFLPSDDVRRIPTYEQSVDAFREGASLLPRPPERVSIPYEDTELPGYLFLPPNVSSSDEPLPTVVCLGGFDSIGEELYFACGAPEALARGYAVVLFEGPGQGAPLRYEELTARKDWENVVGPVIDELETRPEIDGDRIALAGLSFGGYYAPRAAAFEERVSACVALGHFYDPFEAARADSPRASAVMTRLPSGLINGLARLGARFSIEQRWLLENYKWVFDVDTATEMMETLPKYSLSGDAHRIDCPTLVLAGEDDHFVPVEQAHEFADEIGEQATLEVFETETGAGEHCQSGNLSLATGVIYDWLDDVFGHGI